MTLPYARKKAALLLLFFAWIFATPEVAPCTALPLKDNSNLKPKVIIFIWDGLRPDSVNEADTPNLARLRANGVNFTDNHSTYPTFTMINAASIATGGLPGTTGFFGNTIWQPVAKARDITA
jgi:predicted AlkP superfamily pyrophosphatase or phosphodiesterase